MTCTDWSGVDRRALAALYGQEREWWLNRLDWDTEDAWREVEIARCAGRLPGVAVTDGQGRIQALGYCLLDDGVAQLGVSTTASPAFEAAVTDALLEHAARQGATAASYFAPHGRTSDAEPDSALRRAGFDVEPYHYLVRELTPGSGDATSEAWRDADAADVARLLQVAYGRAGRHFAPHGRLDQWERYVTNLVSFAGCGRFSPGASRIVRDGTRIIGAALVTRVSAGVAHLAQLAVDPSARGQGVAGSLLDDAMAAAAAAGCHRMTLLVDASSVAATRLYAARGFTPRERFVAAWLGSLPALAGAA